MWVIREVDARRRVGGASAGIDAERADFPVGRNRPNHEEDNDQGGEEEQETEPPPAATVRFVAQARREAGCRGDDDGLNEHEAGWRCREGGLRKHEPGCCCRERRLHGRRAGWRCGHDGLRRRGTGWRSADDGLRRRRWGHGDRILRDRLRLGMSRLDRRARLGRGATAGQLVKPRLQLRLIGSEIVRLDGTPWETAHVRPR